MVATQKANGTVTARSFWSGRLFPLHQCKSFSQFVLTILCFSSQFWTTYILIWTTGKVLLIAFKIGVLIMRAGKLLESVHTIRSQEPHKCYLFIWPMCSLLFFGIWYPHFAVFILWCYIIGVLLNNMCLLPSTILLKPISIFLFRPFPQYLNALIPSSICQNLVNPLLNPNFWICFNFFYPSKFSTLLNTKAVFFSMRF